MLSAVAVSVKGIPGDGFYTLAEEFGLLNSGDDYENFWQSQLNECYELWQERFYIKK